MAEFEEKNYTTEVFDIFKGKSIEEAKNKAISEFNIPESKITFRVINDVKKNLFGKVKEEAKVWAGYNKSELEDNKVQNETAKSQEEVCIDYLKKIIDKMGIEAEVSLEEKDGSYYVDIDSRGSGAVIGRRGETLDALQYLCSLVVNRVDGEYKRITLDSCGYRAKREETLVTLATRIGNKVLKTGRSTTLEPMNPYERRIIHSAVSKIEGINSKSVGEEPYRKVVISSDHPRKNDNRKGGYKKRKSENSRPVDFKTSFEKDYKRPKPEDDINAGLYGKIEI